MRLDKYLETYKISVSSFARILKVDRSTMYRIFKGEAPRIPLARRIQVITDGEVTVVELLGIEDLVNNSTE